MKTYNVLVRDNASSILYINAKTSREARELAQRLIDKGEPRLNPADFYPVDYRIGDIAEEPNPNDEQRKNAEDNADALAEIEED